MGASSVALCLSLGTSRVTQEALALSAKRAAFSLRLSSATAVIRYAALSNATTSYGGVYEAQRIFLEDDFRDLRRHFARAKKRAPALKVCEETFKDYANHIKNYNDDLSDEDIWETELPQKKKNIDDLSYEEDIWKIELGFSPKQKKRKIDVVFTAGRRYEQKVSRVAAESQGLSLLAIICLFAVTMVTLLVLSLAIFALCDEGNKMVTTMEQLARQEAHENRNKYAPALHILEAIGDYLDPPPSSLKNDAEADKKQLYQHEALDVSGSSLEETIRKAAPSTQSPRGGKKDQSSSFGATSPSSSKVWLADFLELKTDARVAASVLREVEHLHQTRLDCYKIMQGHYKSSSDIFELVTFMSERMESELAIAKAKAASFAYENKNPLGKKKDGKNDIGVQFVVKVPEDLAKKDIHVKCDQYILGHVVTNLLANARKFCFRGSIVMTFTGESASATKGEKWLTFRVRDTGCGIPESIRPRLFNSEVATADSRGTGLGLPSVKLFTSAGGGYAKLVSSNVQDSYGEGGHSEFEFAIVGKIVKTEDVDDDMIPRTTIKKEARRFSLGANQTKNAVFSRSSVTSLTDEDLETLGASKQDPHDIADDDSKHEDTPLTPLPSSLPDKARVVVIDDSQINRRCIIMALKKAAKLAGNHKNWTFSEFENAETSQAFLKAIKDDPNVIVTVDENMQSRGGTMVGSELIRWLRSQCHFKGVIIGASGDEAASKCQLKNGANLTFGKPLSRASRIRDDLEAIFDNRDFQH